MAFYEGNSIIDGDLNIEGHIYSRDSQVELTTLLVYTDFIDEQNTQSSIVNRLVKISSQDNATDFEKVKIESAKLGEEDSYQLYTNNQINRRMTLDFSNQGEFYLRNFENINLSSKLEKTYAKPSSLTVIYEVSESDIKDGEYYTKIDDIFYKEASMPIYGKNNIFYYKENLEIK